jgi:hypothetical protein
VLEVVGSRWVHLPLPDEVSFVMESSARRFVAATLDRLENYILRSPECEDIRFRGMVVGFEDDLGSVRFDWMIVPTGEVTND